MNANAPTLPTRWRSRLTVRALCCAGACTLAAISATGVTAQALFHQPSTAKYVVTVLAPALLALVALARLPLRVLVGLAILVAPVAFVMTFEGLQVTPVVGVLAVATALALGRARAGRAGRLGAASIAAALALIPAIAAAAHVAGYAAWLAETLVIGWLVYLVAAEPGGARFVLFALIASVALQGLLSAYEYHSGHQLNLYNQSGVSTLGSSYFFSYGSARRYTGTLPDPIALGNVLALGLPLMVCAAALERRVWIRLAMAAGGAATLLGLVLSLSRMSWIGGLVGVLACLALLPGRARLPTLLGVAGTAAAVLAVALGLGGASLRKRVTSALHPTNAQSTYATTAQGDQLRLRLWSAAIRTAEAEPLTGTGFGNLVPALDQHGVSVPPAAHAQSWYLQLLGEAGLLGGAALLGLIGAALRDLRVAFRRNRTLAAGAAGALCAVLITWTTDIEPRYIQVSAIVAAVFGLIAALAATRWPGGADGARPPA